MYKKYERDGNQKNILCTGTNLRSRRCWKVCSVLGHAHAWNKWRNSWLAEMHIGCVCYNNVCVLCSVMQFGKHILFTDWIMCFRCRTQSCWVGGDDLAPYDSHIPCFVSRWCRPAFCPSDAMCRHLQSFVGKRSDTGEPFYQCKLLNYVCITRAWICWSLAVHTCTCINHCVLFMHIYRKMMFLPICYSANPCFSAWGFREQSEHSKEWYSNQIKIKFIKNGRAWWPLTPS